MKKWTILLALFVLVGLVDCAEIVKQQLRRVAKLPTDSVKMEFGFSTSCGFYFNGMKPDPLAEAARIRKKLKGDASDAESYLHLGALYDKVDREKESEDAYAKALALYRQQVKEHPDDMGRLARLGEAVLRNGETKEGEALLRRAVKQGPKEWRAWLALGDFIESRSVQAILGNKKGSFHFLHGKVVKPFFDKIPSAEQIAEWQRLSQEARRCYDQAINLAPRERMPYLGRIGSLYFHGTIQEGLHSVQGESAVNVVAAIFTPECAADTRKLAELSPDDPKTVGMAVLVELVFCTLHDKINALPLASEVDSLIDLLPEQSRDFVRANIRRLELLSHSSDAYTAADASEILANVLLITHMGGGNGDKCPEFLRKSAERALPEIVEHLRRVVRLDPRRERAWDLLTRLLRTRGQS